MDIDVLKSIIVEGQEVLEEVHPVQRKYSLEECPRCVFVGVRQAGKSYLLYIKALSLLAEGHDLREMLFVNFDDERLIGYKAEDLDMILKAYRSLYDLKPILFLDEIQNVDGWEHFARRLANLKYTVYITGSNAKMLSRDISSVLGGRYMEQSVFPYSFDEYLRAQGVVLESNWKFGKTEGEVARHLGVYFQWGGFPEALLFADKRRWLNTLYEKIILGDIILRNNIKNENALRLAVQRLAQNIKNPTSYNRLANMVKATGAQTNVSSIIDYVNYCRDACLIFTMENFASKFVEKSTVKKHYFCDNGLLNIFLTDSDTALHENICALDLYKRSLDNIEDEVWFYNKEVELDFYLPARKTGIQACYRLNDDATREREVKALATFHRLYGLDEAVIVTYSESGTIEVDGLAIRIVPLADWLLRK